MDRLSEDVELRLGIHKILRAGVAVSGVLLASGLVLAARGEGSAEPILRAGLIALMCTPLVRVAALAAGYARRRDWPFFWVSFGVLAMLAAAALLGR